MARAWLPGMLTLVLLLGGCGGGQRSTSPVDPTPDPATPLPESNIPRGIGVDPPGGRPVEPPGPDPDAPVILDVTINRTPLPANAWADLHAVSNVSLVSHAWHLGPNAVTRSYSTFASLPIKTLQPGLQRGWVEGWDAQGRHAMREFELEVAKTEPTFFGVRASKNEVAVGEEFEVHAIFEGHDPLIDWEYEWDHYMLVDPPMEHNPRSMRFRALRPGHSAVELKANRIWQDNRWISKTWTADVRVASPPVLIYKHQHSPILDGAHQRGDMNWMVYGDPDAYEWDFGPGATQLPLSPPNLYLQFHEAGMYTGRARAHNIDGWSEWQSVPYAVGRNWTKTAEWLLRKKPAFAVAQGRLWVAEIENVWYSSSILTIKSTEMEQPLDDTIEWDAVSWPIPGGYSLDSTIDGCGRPIFVLSRSDDRRLVAPVTADPQGVDDWWMRSFSIPYGCSLSQFAGSPQRLAVMAAPPHGPVKLFDLPLGMLLSSNAPVNLFDGGRAPALESNQGVSRVICAMPEGVGWILGAEESSEPRVAVSIEGSASEYTLSLPPQDNGYRIGGAKADGRFFLSGTSRHWFDEDYPGIPQPYVLLRTGTSLPLQASDWEFLVVPEHLQRSVYLPESWPGSERVWIDGLGIPADAPAEEFSDPGRWTPISLRAVGHGLSPAFAIDGQLFGIQELPGSKELRKHAIWVVGTE